MFEETSLMFEQMSGILQSNYTFDYCQWKANTEACMLLIGCMVGTCTGAPCFGSALTYNLSYPVSFASLLQ